MADCSPQPTPMLSSPPLSKSVGSVLQDPTTYRSVVGALQYATITRPDIAFSVNKLCQFLQSPTDSHWKAVKRLLRYIKGTLHFGLKIYPSNHNVLQVFSDADWAGCPDDRRSTSGYIVYLGANLVSWSAKKQSTIARSSTESEYRSIANTTAELLWIRSLLQELGVSVSSPPILWCDNLGATYLAANPMFHAQTKHIELDVHFVRDLVVQKHLQVQFLRSQDQIADIMTKPLPRDRFEFLRDKLRLLPQASFACGGLLG
ncbi:hypothetical protein K2173_026358 [Erythroxylum novogranatense]|uniref:Uncharacterized protein n=1 Tax=Erythroxylum novogranatense TaxID=1862640 RepID=A0AAV8SMZ3_9ROSI|nr:hypothetical protein K2173_026358 [Erythroxylum novogranatense]